MNRIIIGCLAVFVLSACAWSEEEPRQQAETVEVHFAEEIGATTDEAVAPPASRATATNLAEGTTVRVLVYRGATANFTAANYVAENTYRVDSNGKLIACVVDDNGKVTNNTGKALRLLKDRSYNFHAVTPALKVNRTNGAATMSVGHGVDCATLFTQVKIPGNGAVSLAMLERRCSKLTFTIDWRAVAGVSSITVQKLVFANMTPPFAPSLHGAWALPNRAAGNVYDAVNSTFRRDPNEARAYWGDCVMLPQNSSAESALTLTIRKNNATTEFVSTTKVTTKFEPGKQYRFTIKSTDAGKLSVTVVIGDWHQRNWNTDLG